MSQYTAIAAHIKADANLPTEYGDFRMRVFVDDEGSEHSVLSVGLADVALDGPLFTEARISPLYLP